MSVKRTYQDKDGKDLGSVPQPTVATCNLHFSDLDQTLSIDLAKLPPEVQKCAMAFGIQTAVGNAANSTANAAKKDGQDSDAAELAGFEAAEERIARLAEGVWATRGTGGAGRSIDLVEAIAQYKEKHGHTVDDDWKKATNAKLADMETEDRKAYEAGLKKDHGEIFVILAEIRAKRTADRIAAMKAASKEAPIDEGAVADL